MSLNEAPFDLQQGIRAFWPESEWENAAAVARLESNWRRFAVIKTTSDTRPCGSFIGYVRGVLVTAEYSIGYFQINSCNFPDWDPMTLYDPYQNCGTAHMLWAENSWRPWYFSCTTLGIC